MAHIRAGKLVDSGGSNNMGADLYSSGVAADIQDVDGLAVLSLERSKCAGVQILVGGAGNAVGSIYLQQSMDGINWVNIVFLDGSDYISVASGVAVNAFVDLADLGGKFLRVFWDWTSGNDKLDVFAQVKQ